MRASTSACVSQVMLVPALLTKGREAQLSSTISHSWTLEQRENLHRAAGAGLEDELATHTLCELSVHTGVLACGARAARGEGLERGTGQMIRPEVAWHGTKRTDFSLIACWPLARSKDARRWKRAGRAEALRARAREMIAEVYIVLRCNECVVS